MHNAHTAVLRQQERELVNRLTKLNYERANTCPMDNIDLVESLEQEIHEIEEQLELLREDIFYCERH